MAVKALFAIAAVLAVAIAMLLPTPGGSKPAAHSQVATLEVGD